MKIKYKNFEFPANPSSVKVLTSSKCVSHSIPGLGSVAQNVSLNPVQVSDEGEFFGECSDEYCAVLQNMLKNKSSGWLMLSSAPPIKAFFTRFNFIKDNKRNCVRYDFEFIEDCSSRKARLCFKSTRAMENENAFDIAWRCSVSVNDIMRLNPFKTPFDLKAGDEVMLR